MKLILLRCFSFCFLLTLIGLCSCSTDNDFVLEEETETENESVGNDEPTPRDTPPTEPPPANTPPTTGSCTEPSNFVFNEKDGLVLVEFENAVFAAPWRLKTDGSSHSGEGYMVWEGQQNLGNPGTGLVTFKIKIENTGTYQFLWSSAVKTGNNGTDHNDTWLRFNDASDFYARNREGTSTVYPKDTGKTPNPEGASKDGWFKIYRSGNDLDFKWQASTFDNNAHDIFIDFDTPGTYTMEISARSSGHGIDKFALFGTSLNKEDATSSTTFSAITCN